MHVRTLQCGHLLELDRYLNDIQALATCLSASEVLQAQLLQWYFVSNQPDLELFYCTQRP